MKAANPTSETSSHLVLIVSVLALSACDAVNDIVDDINDIGNDAEVHYYLSLGTSLSVGVQPNSGGTLLPTNDGYPDQLFDSIQPAFDSGGAVPRELRLNKLGCPGETLDDMINGGNCLYLAGSQLDAAVDFLNDNQGRVHLVTIDIGGNDFRNAGCIGAAVDFTCVDTVSAQIATDLATVLAALSTAAGPNSTVIGMNYYNPYLGSWLEGAAGQVVATDSALAAGVLNNALSTTYATAGITQADVYAAFESDDFTTIVPTALPAPNDQLPLNVANICTFTYMCDVAPVGPDIHATNAGYSQIANTIEALIP